MQPWVLDVNDIAIRLVRGSEPPLISPSVALPVDGGILFGEAALSQACLRPSDTVRDFWTKLSQEPLTRSHPGARTRADLVYWHLLNLWESSGSHSDDEEIIVVTPSVYSPQQIALLLGIMERCPFQVRALVDTATAAAAGVLDSVTEANVICQDLRLYGISFHQMLTADGRLTVGKSQDLPHLGHDKTRQTITRMIADRFIQESRFNPLRSGATEQLLADRLDDWLAELAGAESAAVSLPTEPVRAIQLTRNQVADTLVDLVDRMEITLKPLLAPSSNLLLVPEQFLRLPGVKDAFTALPDVSALPYGIAEISAGALSAAAGISPQANGIPRVLAAKLGNPTPSQEGGADPPTHLLAGSDAWPLGDKVLLYEDGDRLYPDEQGSGGSQIAMLEFAGNSLLLHPNTDQIKLNDQSLSAPMGLAIGDVIRYRDHILHCIRIRS